MGILADTLRGRLAAYVHAQAPTRVLIGGLPDFLIERIAQGWNSTFQVYLVSAASNAPLPANVRRCRADDLTAERQDSWVALVGAHESRGIQESIRSSGAGTVRELWPSGFPWNPCELPGARWRDVRDAFIDALGLVAQSSEVARCIDQFRDELRGDVSAAERFFSVLDTFAAFGVTYDDLSFQLGFPRHQPGRVLRRKGDPEAVLALLDSFIERFKEEVVDETLDHFIEAARIRFAGDQPMITRVESALKFFANQFRDVSPADAENPVRSWRTVFQVNRDAWDTLSADVLAQLLGQGGEKPIIASCSISSGQGIQIFDVGENHIIARDRNAASHSVAVDFEFSQGLVDQAAEAAAAGTPWRLFAKVNRDESRLANPLPAGKGPHSYPVAVPSEGKQTMKFFVGPTTSTEKASSKGIVLWECCQEFPLLIANSHAKLRGTKRKRFRDEHGNTRFEVEQEITLPSPGRVALHGFIFRLQGQLNVVLPGDATPVTVSGLAQVSNSVCQQFLLNVDVVDGAELTFTWNDAGNTQHRAVISFEFKGEAGPREDSLTGVILRAHSGGNAKEIKKLLGSVKQGIKVPPGDIPVKESGKPIAMWEAHQQQVDQGWWPILASEGSSIMEQRLAPQVDGYVVVSSALSLDDQANAWQNTVHPTTAIGKEPPELLAYVDARRKVIEALASQFELSVGEEISEMNIARKAMVGFLDRGLLENYVKAYMDLLVASAKATFPGAWRWYARAVDSALIFAEKATAPSSHLLGPFHPVTLSRNYFLQRCLGERLLDDRPSPVALTFAQVQPVALGYVMDAQLQAAPGIAFPTGDTHWLWIYRQQRPSELPGSALVEWLRQSGLDPQTGPLAVDAEILPQTLNQYVLAYPAHQSLRLSLDDCTQRTFEVLRDHLLPPNSNDVELDRLWTKLPGGVSVYDPVTKVKRVNGELLAYDPDLPLRWHHGKPPQALPVDLATLPRSSRVDFQATPRGGAFSAAVPTARRALLEFSQGGLEVATSLEITETTSGLEGSVAELLRAWEPPGQQLSWGTSLTPTSGPKANWTLCSASQVDPRLFIDYVQRNPGTALWTYRLFSLDGNKTPEFGRGHYLIARVSPSLSVGLQSLVASIGLAVTPNDLLTELAQSGLTLGDEFLRTGRTAEGALGQYLVERLLWQPTGQSAPLPHSTSSGGQIQSAGFLLQIDPFNKLLETLAFLGGESSVDASKQRSDIVSIHLQFCDGELWIRPVVVESKFVLTGQANVEGAVSQAAATATHFDHLLEFCIYDANNPQEALWAQPERLLLAELIHLGLRLSRGSFTGQPEEWHRFEQIVLSRVLSGNFRRDNAQALAIIHHPGPSANNVATNLPHAFVSFADANLAKAGTPPAAYTDIQQALSLIVRHTCGQAAPTTSPTVPQGVAANPETVASDRANQAQESRASNIVQPVASSSVESTALMAPSAGQPMATPQTKPPLNEIAKAHIAFDAAFKDFIGNRQAIEKLRDDLVDAVIKHPPHLPSAYLLTGNPSTGKTTLANKVAKFLGVTFVKLVGTNIRNEGDLVEQVDNAFSTAEKKPKVSTTGSQGVPEHEYPECLIFIDEIHLVKGRAQEGLLTLTEPKDRYVRLRDRICRFPRATYMAATTRDSEIDKALRTRFGNPIHLRDYTAAEVATMLAVKSTTWASWTEAVRLGLARLSRCIPREAERLAQKLERKLTVARERLSIEEALEKLRIEEGLDRNGLDHVCWEVLQHMTRQRRPVGRETLAKQLGVADEDKLVSEIMPALQNLGLIEQVAGGQKITDRGRNYLRNEAPPVQAD